MYVKGTGMTKFGIHAETTHELCYEAIMEALEDADMPLSEIDEIIISKGDSRNDGERQKLFPGMLSSMLQDQNIPIIRVMAACSGGGAAIWDAVNSKAGNILVVGVDKLSNGPTTSLTDNFIISNVIFFQ